MLLGNSSFAGYYQLMAVVVGRDLEQFVSKEESQTKANRVKEGVKHTKAISAMGEHALSQPSWKNESTGISITFVLGVLLRFSTY